MKMHTHKKEIGPKWILKVQENGERGIWDEKEGKWETLTLLEEMEIMHEGMWVVVAEWDQRESKKLSSPGNFAVEAFIMWTNLCQLC